MKKYQQLTQEKRYHIWGLLKSGYSQDLIAKEVGVNKSTISRETRRNRGNCGYRPKQANEKAITRRMGAKKRIKLTDSLKETVAEKLRLDWSPEQISGYLKKARVINISHELIYQFILSNKKSGGCYLNI
jgi:IS30 family transposase